MNLITLVNTVMLMMVETYIQHDYLVSTTLQSFCQTLFVNLLGIRAVTYLSLPTHVDTHRVHICISQYLCHHPYPPDFEGTHSKAAT